MTSEPHLKHEKLARPSFGEFGRREWAFTGTRCEEIERITSAIILALSPTNTCAYVDASHKTAEPGTAHTAAIRYTDHQHFREVIHPNTFGRNQHHLLFSGTDLILVNGNHFQAARQVVFIDPAKEASLRKRLDQITQPGLFLLAAGVTGVYDFLKEAIPHWEQIPVLAASDIDGIAAFFKKEMNEAVPPLMGLVLAGGRSRRMGHDKTREQWHGREQRYHIYDLLKPRCREVYISCREDQRPDIDPVYQSLPDTFTGLGPYGAILSAFRYNPDVAWLVVASDLPLLNAGTLDYLLANRHPGSCATTYKSPFDSLPEPLVTLWEPKSYPLLLSFLSLGISCPRKVLIQNDAYVLAPQHDTELMNVNTPGELETAHALLKKQ